jgi:hypothetical protein
VNVHKAQHRRTKRKKKEKKKKETKKVKRNKKIKKMKKCHTGSILLKKVCEECRSHFIQRKGAKTQRCKEG